MSFISRRVLFRRRFGQKKSLILLVGDHNNNNEIVAQNINHENVR